MDWEGLVRDLEEQQEFLRSFVLASKEQHAIDRPGTDFEGLVSTQPAMLLQRVRTNHASPHVALAAVASSQLKFNQIVISLLTDLDHRKSEP